MDEEITQAFNQIRQGIDGHVGLAESMAKAELEEGLIDELGSEYILSRVKALLDAKDRLEKLKQAISQIEVELESFENGILEIGDGCTNAKIDGRRFLSVKLTKGMINQKMLTLTLAKQRGLVEDGERFTIRMPDGETIETQLVQPGNRLQERGAFGRLYKAEEVEEGNLLHLVEQTTGVWEVKVFSPRHAARSLIESILES